MRKTIANLLILTRFIMIVHAIMQIGAVLVSRRLENVVNLLIDVLLSIHVLRLLRKGNWKSPCAVCR